MTSLYASRGASSGIPSPSIKRKIQQKQLRDGTPQKRDGAPQKRESTNSGIQKPGSRVTNKTAPSGVPAPRTQRSPPQHGLPSEAQPTARGLPAPRKYSTGSVKSACSVSSSTAKDSDSCSNSESGSESGLSCNSGFTGTQSRLARPTSTLDRGKSTENLRYSRENTRESLNGNRGSGLRYPQSRPDSSHSAASSRRSSVDSCSSDCSDVPKRATEVKQRQLQGLNRTSSCDSKSAFGLKKRENSASELKPQLPVKSVTSGIAKDVKLSSLPKKSPSQANDANRTLNAPAVPASRTISPGRPAASGLPTARPEGTASPSHIRKPGANSSSKYASSTLPRKSSASGIAPPRSKTSLSSTSGLAKKKTESAANQKESSATSRPVVERSSSLPKIAHNRLDRNQPANRSARSFGYENASKLRRPSITSQGDSTKAGESDLKQQTAITNGNDGKFDLQKHLDAQGQGRLSQHENSEKDAESEDKIALEHRNGFLDNQNSGTTCDEVDTGIAGGSKTIRKINKELERLNSYLDQQLPLDGSGDANRKSDSSDKSDYACLCELESYIGSPGKLDKDAEVRVEGKRNKCLHDTKQMPSVPSSCDRNSVCPVQSKLQSNVYPSTLEHHKYQDPTDTILMPSVSDSHGYADPADCLRHNSSFSSDATSGSTCSSYSDRNSLSDVAKRLDLNSADARGLRELMNEFHNEDFVTSESNNKRLPSIPDNLSASSGSCLSAPRRVDFEEQGTEEGPYSLSKPGADRSATSSPFKRIQPKVVIPPPELKSLGMPKDYNRTPSTDGEEIPVSQYYTEADEIKQKARERAMLIWKAKEKQEEASSRKSLGSTGSDVRSSVHCQSRDRLDTDVFYPISSRERHLSDSSETCYSTSAGSRTSDSVSSMYRVDRIPSEKERSEEKDRKKKSKLKKFFKKLSSKKDPQGKGDLEQVREESSRNALFDTSYDDYVSPFRPQRRRSDGVLSSHSVSDLYDVGQRTPNSKKRSFLFGFSKKDKRRTRSTSAYGDSVSDRGSRIISPELIIPSETVRALCSPNMTRRNVHMMERRSSDPTLHRLDNSSSNRSSQPGFQSPLSPCHMKIATQRNTSPSNFVYKTAVTKRLSTESGGSIDEENEYENFPFSRVNMKAPPKPRRSPLSDSPESEPYASHRLDMSVERNSPLSKSLGPHRRQKRADGSFIDSDLKSGFNMVAGLLSIDMQEKKEQRVLSSSSDDKSIFSSSDSGLVPDFSTKRDNLMADAVPYDHTGRASSSLRRTPLRNNSDNFSKLVEVHRQTVERIAQEVSRLSCDCKSLLGLEWEDFDIADDAIHLGLANYMVVPVTGFKKNGEKKCLTAWLRLDQMQSSRHEREFPDIYYPRSTLHRGALHVCHTIEQRYAAPFQENIPKTLQFDRVYISPQTPKMTLSRYVGMTADKHNKYPDLFEREAAMILLQVVKGVQHFYKNGLFITAIEADNIFLLNKGPTSVILSPRREPNRCPSVVVGLLPGLGNSFQKTDDDVSAETGICRQLAFLMYELLHSPCHEELRSAADGADISLVLATLPNLKIKSVYSRFLQYVVDVLLNPPAVGPKGLDELRTILEVILFGPADVCDISETDSVNVISKWLSRRCVDMVTHILKEVPMAMIVAGSGHLSDQGMSGISLELSLECEFLADTTPGEIYRISKLLNR